MLASRRRGMDERRLAFDFFGCRLLVESGDPALDSLFRTGFGRFRVEDRDFADPVFRLSITAGQPEPPSGIPLVWSGALPEGGNGRVFEDDQRSVHLLEGACCLNVDIRASSASLVVAPDGMARFMGSPSMVFLDFVLHACGQNLVHAACLVSPLSGRAILIFGQSGRGKTSTAIALARGGYGLMTDDAAVLGETVHGPRAWGLPRDLKVHRRTAELLPWIDPHVGGTWDASGEQPVRLAGIGGEISLAEPEPRPLEAIVILEERSAGPHHLEQIEKRSALLAISADNVPWYPTGVPGRAKESFEALARAVAAVPTFGLSAGSDLDTLPRVFIDRLRRAGSFAEQGR